LAFGEVLAQQTVRVLVCASLPWPVRVAEVDINSGCDRHFGMMRHLHASVPGERAAKVSGQLDDLLGERSSYRDGVPAGHGPADDGTRMVNRQIRSTSVAIWLLVEPISKSPSQ